MTTIFMDLLLAGEEWTRTRSRDQGGDRIRGTPQSGTSRRLGTNEARCGRRRLLTAWRRAGGQLGRPFAAQAEGGPVAGPASHYCWDMAPSTCRCAAGSSRRELKPSFVNTLRRWYSTVRGLIKSDLRSPG